MANQYSEAPPSDELEMQRRRAEAMKLRVRGKTYDYIATELGVTPGMAHMYVKQALQQRAKELAEDTSEYRTIQLTRMERAMDAIYERVELGSLDHIETYIRLENRMSRLLGTDSARRIEVEDKTPQRRAITEAQLLEKARGITERLEKRLRGSPRELGPVIDVEMVENAGAQETPSSTQMPGLREPDGTEEAQEEGKVAGNEQKEGAENPAGPPALETK